MPAPKGIIRGLSDRPVGDPNVSVNKACRVLRCGFRAAVWALGYVGRKKAQNSQKGDAEEKGTGAKVLRRRLRGEPAALE
jgi:hypothetical protein